MNHRSELEDDNPYISSKTEREQQNAQLISAPRFAAVPIIVNLVVWHISMVGGYSFAWPPVCIVISVSCFVGGLFLLGTALSTSRVGQIRLSLLAVLSSIVMVVETPAVMRTVAAVFVCCALAAALIIQLAGRCWGSMKPP